MLQEGTFERVGEDRTRRVHVRIVAATNRDLRHHVEAGRFREDLFYRLAVFPIEVPPLRERRDDIAPLAAHLLRQAEPRIGRRGLRLTVGDVRRLEHYEWPGNVRELANVIERAAILAHGDRLAIDAALREPGAGARSPAVQASPDWAFQTTNAGAIETQAEQRARERANLVAALERCGGKVYGSGGAAELLGVPPTTLASRLRTLGIQPRAGGLDQARHARATLNQRSAGRFPRPRMSRRRSESCWR